MYVRLMMGNRDSTALPNRRLGAPGAGGSASTAAPYASRMPVPPCQHAGLVDEATAARPVTVHLLQPDHVRLVRSDRRRDPIEVQAAVNSDAMVDVERHRPRHKDRTLSRPD